MTGLKKWKRFEFDIHLELLSSLPTIRKALEIRTLCVHVQEGEYAKCTVFAQNEYKDIKDRLYYEGFEAAATTLNQKPLNLRKNKS